VCVVACLHSVVLSRKIVFASTIYANEIDINWSVVYFLQNNNSARTKDVVRYFGIRVVGMQKRENSGKNSGTFVRTPQKWKFARARSE